MSQTLLDEQGNKPLNFNSMFQSKKFILKGLIFYGFISETTRGEKKIRNNYSQVEETITRGVIFRVHL